MAFAASGAKKNKPKMGFKLNITSMMDMFTIILVFLLKSFSTDGQLVTPAEGLKLPDSLTDENAKPGLELVIAENLILVEGQPLAKVSDVIDQEDFVIAPLEAELSKRAEAAKLMEQRLGTPFQGEVIIQGHKDIPFKLLFKVMASCAITGWGKMKLIVYRPE